MSEILIRDARIADIDHLDAIAFRSKAHWGYDEAFMEACREELCVPVAAIDAEIVRVGESDGVVQAFYRLVPEGEEAEIEAFFVTPERIGSGLGKALWRDLIDQAHAAGSTRLLCQSDPFAEGFYIAMGMRRVGERASSSIAGRMLPLLEMAL